LDEVDVGEATLRDLVIVTIIWTRGASYFTK
jgi:hypothetical protein